jgi:hypothetical protein
VVAAYLVAAGLGDVCSVKGDVEALDEDEDWMLRVKRAVEGANTLGDILLSR